MFYRLPRGARSNSSTMACVSARAVPAAISTLAKNTVPFRAVEKLKAETPPGNQTDGDDEHAKRTSQCHIAIFNDTVDQTGKMRVAKVVEIGY